MADVTGARAGFGGRHPYAGREWVRGGHLRLRRRRRRPAGCGTGLYCPWLSGATLPTRHRSKASVITVTEDLASISVRHNSVGLLLPSVLDRGEGPSRHCGPSRGPHLRSQLRRRDADDPTRRAGHGSPGPGSIVDTSCVGGTVHRTVEHVVVPPARATSRWPTHSSAQHYEPSSIHVHALCPEAHPRPRPSGPPMRSTSLTAHEALAAAT
jgi:hypothetical protein